jgi:hypothetical protein
MIDAIPETAWDLNIISPAQKEFYKKLLTASWEKGIMPTYTILNPDAHCTAIK